MACGGEVNLLSKLWLPSYSGLGAKVFWIYFHKWWLTDWLNHQGVCRTAPPTPDLAITVRLSHPHASEVSSSVLQLFPRTLLPPHPPTDWSSNQQLLQDHLYFSPQLNNILIVLMQWTDIQNNSLKGRHAYKIKKWMINSKVMAIRFSKLVV